MMVLPVFRYLGCTSVRATVKYGLHFEEKPAVTYIYYSDNQ